MRPDFDLEHVEAPVCKVDEHRLIGRVRPAIPADPGCSVIDRQRDGHDRPFEAPERAVHLLGIDALARFIKRAMLAGRAIRAGHRLPVLPPRPLPRSEEHTSELQSLMRISYAVFCLKK